MIKMRKLLVMICSILLLAACVTERKDHIDILEYWQGNYYGWYEITDASGKYAELNGTREDCKADIGLNYKKELVMEVNDMNDEGLYYFTGNYSADADHEHGKVWFYQVSDSLSCDLNGIASYEGMNDFFVFTGVIGEDTDQMIITFYLREYGLLWDDVKDELLPEGYGTYQAEVIKQNQFDIFKEFMIGDYQASVKFSNGSGELAVYEVDESDFNVMVRSNGPYEINYWFEFENQKLVLFSEWEEMNQTSPVEMKVLRAGSNAATRQYRSDVSVLMQSEGSQKTSVHLEGMIGNEENGLLVDVSFLIDKALPYEYASKNDDSKDKLNYEIGDLLELYDQLGNSYDSFQIRNDGNQEVKYSAFVDVSGIFNQESIDGTMYFTQENEQLIFAQFYFAINDTSYEDVQSQLMKRYGKPVEEGVEPYVEGNGGASRFTRFETDTAEILIQKGDQNDYTWIEVRLKK